MAEFPPTFDSFEALQVSSEYLSRVAQLRALFRELFQCDPTHFIRAPGRVNLIGEHIDYSGYPVLPMALQQDVLILVAVNGKDEIVVRNSNSAFPARIYGTSLPIEIDSSKQDWGNYFLCGLKGVAEHVGLKALKGMNCLLDGIVPQASGLSSSSACVCCSALTTAFINGCMLSKLDIASVCARSERYVGTEGGGMDQAISFLGERGSAMFIEFNPLKATPAPLPSGGVFVIANSLVEANKYISAGSCYNKRVVECRIAAKLIAHAEGLDHTTLRTLGQVQQALGNPSLADMLKRVKQHIKASPYTKQDLAALLNLTEQEMDSTVLSPFTVSQPDFLPFARALHVYSETQRVYDFKEAKTLEDLGRLMNESHESCSRMFECSCPELDELTQLCRDQGALGSRLTGAGWGGCTVSLVPESHVASFIEAIKAKYYTPDPKRASKVEESLFSTGPCAGAAIILA